MFTNSCKLKQILMILGVQTVVIKNPKNKLVLKFKILWSFIKQLFLKLSVCCQF